MRIGTWNLNNRLLTNKHCDLLLGERCDVWLLTEVNRQAEYPKGRIAGFRCHLSSGVMECRQHWAAVLSLQPFIPLLDPHPASAAAIVNGITFCSTILPWATCGNKPPWIGSCLVEKLDNTLSSLLAALPHQDLVWGGDWNQNLTGGWENVGTNEGQNSIKSAIRLLDLQVSTSDLLHQLGAGHHTIDHIAVPSVWKVKSAERVAANGLSDHDAYVIEAYEPRQECQGISENAYFRWVNEGRLTDRDLGHWLDAENEFHDARRFPTDGDETRCLARSLQRSPPSPPQPAHLLVAARLARR